MKSFLQEILEKIDELLEIIENLEIKKEKELNLLKVVLELKLKFISFLEKNRNFKNKKRLNDAQKRKKLILNFVKEKGGRVGVDEFKVLKIAGRSLRRYLRELKIEKKIESKKVGRKIFYEIPNA